MSIPMPDTVHTLACSLDGSAVASGVDLGSAVAAASAELTSLAELEGISGVSGAPEAIAAAQADLAPVLSFLEGFNVVVSLNLDGESRDKVTAALERLKARIRSLPMPVEEEPQ